MRLSHLLEAIKGYKLAGNPDSDITGLSYDSRKIKSGGLFVAIKGNALDGHLFIQTAIDNGAKAVLVENDISLPPEIAVIKVSDTRRELSRLAERFYGYPFRDMDATGVTGTSGKTTVTYMIESMLSAAGKKTGVIGTVNTRFMGRVTPSSVTTPESLDLMCIAREMANEGVTNIVLEASSHAIHQKRTIDLPFRVAVFTNLSRDHLDYHDSLDSYFEAKSELFRNLPVMVNGKKSCAVINMDDPRGKELCGLTKASVLTYGLNGNWDIRAENIKADLNGLSAELISPYGNTAIKSPLLGEVNIYNILAASGAALASGVTLDEIKKGIANLGRVPGRLERVPNRAALSIIVDYSHKPDALSKVLNNLRPFVKKRVITVFGCGGDRDRGKRYDMGLIAGKNSDIVIITSDNPRTEEPEFIISQIEKGVLDSGMKRAQGPQPENNTYLIDADRGSAIRRAVSIADKEDTILIAGKGHEDYQITGQTKRHFDDREEALKAVDAL
ncbi:MAG: UDP-N-acetylmuramoyl-L-alanyl-D-glutamate--2,6-diaminopimelate ligase [Deltaproteobacteria bacterium]|nr:UDP-N-acetylmuramoyl-L-alanyl-D-glutamate--2,6-diaminopimelate ligase [Deltaproteobacteria bacterium]